MMFASLPVSTETSSHSKRFLFKSEVKIKFYSHGKCLDKYWKKREIFLRTGVHKVKQ